jgi:hypothetical protein
MNSIIFSVTDKRKAAKILVMRNWLSRVVGLHFVTKSVHGFLFEDLCHALITWKSIPCEKWNEITPFKSCLSKPDPPPHLTNRSPHLTTRVGCGR